VPIATATYSIVATDSKTRQVGGAGATCLENSDIYEKLYLSAPGLSVLHTQGLLLARTDPIVTTAVEMMKQGASPEAVLTAMKELDTLTSTYDLDDTNSITLEDVELRQYGMADFSSTAVYSGRSLASLFNLFGFGDSEVADVGKSNFTDRYTYHALGNVVKSGTVSSLQSGFEEQTDDFNFGLCDMAGKLMTAMYRVPAGGFGDVRCLRQDGRSATGAYLHIDNEDGTELIHINEIDTDTKEPVEVLKEAFVEWRKNNPCEDKSSGTAPTAGISPLIKAVSMLGIASLILSSLT